MSYNIESASQGDIIKTSSALLAQRIFEGKPLDDRLWVVSSALTVIGFVAYHLLITSWFRSENYFAGSAKVAIDDIARFSMMFGISRILSGESLSDPAWVQRTGSFITSIAIYDLLLHNVISRKLNHLDETTQTAVSDVIKFGTVLAAQNAAIGGTFDKTWMMSSGGFLTGLVVYDVAISKFIKGKL
jgi:hypothetical protein